MNNNYIIQENNSFSLQIKVESIGLRIDQFLALQLPMFSRSLLKKLIENKQVIINHTVPAKPSYLLKEDDTITLLSIPIPTERFAPKIISNLGITIIHKDADFMIINKPAGLVVHPPEKTYTDIALTDWLVHTYPEIKDVGDPDRPGIVHRLDRNTSGIMIIALTNHAYQTFVQMFKDRQIQKTYIALAQGHTPASGSIDFSIGRHPVQKNIMHAFTAIPENSCARDALTFYKTLQHFKDYSLVQVEPKTGRTHQIRVHLKAIGHALLGDTVYGTASKKIAYHALHAHRLAFTYQGMMHEYTSPLDPVLKKIVDTSCPA